jgi:hypothetical protein
MVDAANQLEYVPIADAVSEGTVNAHENYTTEDFLVYDCWETVKEVCKRFGYKARKPTATDSRGFLVTSLNTKKGSVTLLDAIAHVPTAYGTNEGEKTWRSFFPCYKNLEDKDTLHYVIVLRPTTSSTTIDQVKARFPSIPIPRFGKI